jgi:hypothetical protein
MTVARCQCCRTATPCPSRRRPANSALSVSVDAAKSIAIRTAGGGRVTKVESETEHGRAVWDVDVLLKGVEHDIDVDRATGSVLRHRLATANANNRNHAATTEPGDDRGDRANEPGDDRGDRAAEPGDDRGHGTEAGDDHGGHGNEAGDDHGSGGHGSDD